MTICEDCSIIANEAPLTHPMPVTSKETRQFYFVATSPSSVAVSVYDLTAGDEDVSATVFDTSTIIGNEVYFKLKNFTDGHLYRAHVSANIGAERLDHVMFLRAIA